MLGQCLSWDGPHRPSLYSENDVFYSIELIDKLISHEFRAFREPWLNLQSAIGLAIRHVDIIETAIFRIYHSQESGQVE